MKKFLLCGLMMVMGSVFAGEVDTNRYHVEFGGKVKHKLNLYFGETTDTVEVSNMTSKPVAVMKGNEVRTKVVEYGEKMTVKHVGGEGQPFEVTFDKTKMLKDNVVQSAHMTPILMLNEPFKVSLDGEEYTIVIRSGFAQ